MYVTSCKEHSVIICNDYFEKMVVSIVHLLALQQSENSVKLLIQREMQERERMGIVLASSNENLPHAPMASVSSGKVSVLLW